MNFYEKNLGAKILMKSTSGTRCPRGAPQNVPPGMNRDGTYCTRVQLGDTTAWQATARRRSRCAAPYLRLSVDSDEEAERIYATLTEGGEVFMKMGETFFAHRFGQFRDKFGVNWMVIHEKPMQRPA